MHLLNVLAFDDKVLTFAKQVDEGSCVQK